MDPAKIRSGQLRVVFVVVGFVIALLGLGQLIQRPYSRLASEGVVAEGVVTGSRRQEGWLLEFAFEVEGVRYERSTPREPRPVGTPLTVFHLPDRPAIAWADAPPTPQEIWVLAFPIRALAGIMGGVGVSFGVSSEIALRRARRGRPESFAVTGGRMVWLLMASALVVSVNDADSGRVIDRAFALDRLGVSTAPLRSLAAGLIALPGAWTSADVFALVQARPASAWGRWGFLRWILSRGPVDAGLARERTRTLVTVVGYGLLVVGWIAWASFRGV